MSATSAQRATIVKTGKGYIVEWEHEQEGTQFYYTRVQADAQRMADIVNAEGVNR